MTKKRNKLPHYLAYHRKRLRLTQAQMAELVGCYDGSVISRFESGESLPTLKVALAYQAVLHLPLTELFAGIYEAVERQTEIRARKVADKLLSI